MDGPSTADDATAILASLEGGGSAGIYSRVSSFLLPFGDLIPLDSGENAGAPLHKNATTAAAKKRKPAAVGKRRPRKVKVDDTAVLRPLAKRFLPFLSRALKLLPSSLWKCPKEEGERAGELFAVYRLVLDCLACVASCLDGSPSSVHLQRCSLLLCLENWGMYEEAEQEGIRILGSLGLAAFLASPEKPQKGRTTECAGILPDWAAGGTNDADLALVFVKVVTTIVRCAYKSKTKNDGVYRRILLMVEEVHHWLRLLDSKAFEKNRSALVDALCKCSLFLAGDCMSFNADLVHCFCVTVLKELLQSSSKDLFPKVACQICSALSLQWETRYLLMLEMLKCSVDFIYCRCQVNVVYMVNQIFEFIRYIVDNCQTFNLGARQAVSDSLLACRSNLHKVSPIVASVLGLYVIALDYERRNAQLQHGQLFVKHSDDGTLVFLNTMDHLQLFSESLDVLDYFCHGSSDSTCGFDECAQRMSSLTLDCKTSSSCILEHGEVSVLSYVDALGFLCQQLNEYVNLAWKHMISEKESFTLADIDHVENALYQYRDFFLKFRSNEQLKSEISHKNWLVMIRTVTSSLKISLGLTGKTQMMITSIDQVISCQWIEPQELKYLASSFYSVGVSLCNVGEVSKASIALRLCCTTLWVHVRMLCKLFSSKSPNVNNRDLSEDAIKEASTDACAKSAIALDVIHQCGGTDLHVIVVDSLLSWSAAEQLLETSVNPSIVVKQWVKIICKDSKDVNAVDSVPSLYSLISSKCNGLSKRALCIILEQELLAYEEIEARYSKLCQSMQIRLIDILMDIYASENNVLPRSRILVKKGQILRACVSDSLSSSFHCISEALSLLESVHNDTADDTVLHYQLALTYSLHAHCAQETNQKSEVILHDIRCALESWSRICMATDLDIENEGTIQLLCSMADLAGLKGHLNFQLQLCKLILIFGRRMNFPVGRCMDVLWSNRRISHAFCSSPIDVKFIVDVSKEHGVQADLISFWLSCMENSPSSSVGFLQVFMLSDSMLPQMSNLSSKGSLDQQITVEEVKKVALTLVSNVPVSSYSAFAAGYLFFDLSERLLLVGKLFEALTHAREALRLRTKILQRKFIYLLGQQPGKMTTVQDHINELSVTKEWPTISGTKNLEGCFMSPWSVLKSYLESIFQVGLIYELIGNGIEAEGLFRTGKRISCSLGFPVLGIAFSSHLGQVYRKKQLLDLAQDELDTAKMILLESESIISCRRCKAALHGTIGLQVGDLQRSIFEATTGVRSTELLSNALDQYKSALQILKCTEITEDCYFDEVPLASKERDAQASGKGANGKLGGRRNSKSATCNPSWRQNLGDQSNLSVCKSKICRKDTKCVKNCHTIDHTNSIDEAVCEEESKLFEPGKVSKQICKCNYTSMGSKLNCWRWFLAHVMEVGSMCKIINIKWECHRRRLLLKLLTEIGRCMSILSDSHEVHETLWQSLSLLLNTELICQTGIHHHSLLTLVGEENLCDIFPIQRAELLYNIGLFCVKECLSDGSRTCCALSKVQISVVLSWLLLAFILSQEIPLLFQQVSRLIATVLLLFMSTGNFSLPFSFQSLNGSQLAAFFHQASVGSYLEHMYFSSAKDKGCGKTLQTDGLTDLNASSRVAPAKLSDFEKFVNNFFETLPGFSVICISFLGGDYVNLLGETLLLPSFFPAWMLLSRFHPKEQPIVMLLPVNSAKKEDEYDTKFSLVPATENKESVITWECPWGSTLLDHVAPEYKTMMEKNSLILSGGALNLMDEKKRRSMWWSERTRLNNCLRLFLRTIEDSWLGPWRCLLLGQCSDSKHLDATISTLSHILKSEYREDVSVSLLKVILGGAQSLSDIKSCISQLLLYNGCLGRGGCCRAESFRAFSSTIDGESESLSERTCKLLEAVGQSVQESFDREPIVLVLDADLQMLPWENFPVLRTQEVYRMPSMSSISATLGRQRWHCEQAQGSDTCIPSVDPLDAYYLLNPSGDLNSTQVEFEGWFINQKWEGKSGQPPTIEELTDALQKHDLFLYFGHGNGMQYIPGNAIRKLDHCAATLLMGCSSGSLNLSGSYAPHGAPLSYLLAGSPAVIANLWDVSDKDIDRFGKALLSSWLQEWTAHCTRCNRVAKECECLHVDAGDDKSVRTRSRVSKGKNLNESRQGARRKSSKMRIASSMSEARDACKLPVLIGAAPVCYGVPTLITSNRVK